MKNSRKASKSQRADYHKFISWRLCVFARNNYFLDDLTFAVFQIKGAGLFEERT